MIFLKPWIKRLLLGVVLAFVVRKLLESDDPRAQRVGRTLNRFTRSAPRTRAAA